MELNGLEIYARLNMRVNAKGSTLCRQAAEGFLHLNPTEKFLVFASENDSTSLCSTVAKCAEEWQNQGSIVSVY